MIQEFYVKNFKSIKEKQGISFLPNKKMNNGYEEHLFINVSEKVKLLKLGVLYGYNASGKSNILSAMNFLRTLVNKAPNAKDEKIGFDPFLLDSDSINTPGVFSLIFYIDAIKYEYYIELNNDRILSESLFYTPEIRKTKLFSRVYDEVELVSKISFGKSCGLNAKEKTFLEGNTLENCTVLAAYRKTNVNSEQLDKVSEYFRNHILPLVTPRVILREWCFDKLKHNFNQKNFFLELLSKADFQISDLEIKEDSIELTKDLLEKIQQKGLPNKVFEELKSKKTIESNELLFSHTTTKGAFPLPSEKESLGTMRYFGLGGILNELISSSKYIFIDEIETSLHPALVDFFIQQFLMNSKDSQLFITTHNQFLMEPEYMRNDMVWFCEKDEEGSSQYYSLQEFKLHKNISIMNYYRAGKLGAIPIFGSPVYKEGLKEK
ncbi:MAG: ATP-binding protein [Spirochaetia bacterium]|nr:ATP-binding protein [Spirochaetia bacterium]